MRIGVKSDLPAIAYVDTTQPGDLQGFEIDLARGVAKRILGDPDRARLVGVTSENRIPKLLSGEIDLILATMTITPERLAQIDFSNVYYKAGQTLLVNPASKIRSYRDLAGHTVCTAQASTSAATLARVAPAARVVLRPTYGMCYDVLRDGGVDAMSTDDVILLGFAFKDPKFTMLDERFTFEPYGIGLRKNSASLKSAVNDAFKSIRRDGDYDSSYQRWFRQPLPRGYGYWLDMDPALAAKKFADQSR